MADWLASPAMVGAAAVVIKHARTNNALAVSFANAAHGEALEALVAAADAGGEGGAGGEAADGAGGRRESDPATEGASCLGVTARGGGESRPGPGDDQWVLQRCFDDPALVGAGERQGSSTTAAPGLSEPVKFTIRVNVLAVGRATVLVHSECLVHCATRGWRAADWGNTERHISNHSVQRSNSAYNAAVHTLTLQQLGAKLDSGELALWRTRHDATAGSREGDYQAGPAPWGKPVSDSTKQTRARGDAGTCGTGAAAAGASGEPQEAAKRLLGLVLEAVAALFARASGSGFGTEWLPQPGCFELFGLDFLPEWEDGSMCLRLLEVNEGPALGALAMPAACGRVAEDAWRVIADPWLEAARGLAAGGASAAAGDGRASCAWAASLAESLRFGRRVAGSEWVVALVLASSRGEPLPVFLPHGFLEHAAMRLKREEG